MPEHPNKIMPALYGGIIIGAISGIPFLNLVNCLCCAGVLFGGLMSVFFYKNELREGMPPLTSGDAVQLGALAGVFGAVISTIISASLMKIVGNISGEAIVKMLQDFQDKLPPGALDEMEQKMAEGAITFASLVISLIVDTIFGLLGGLIGYAIFKPKQQFPMTPPVPPR